MLKLLAGFLVLFVSSPSLYADAKALRKLEKSDARPTMGELLQALGEVPTQNPYEADRINSTFNEALKQIDSLPKVIAHMENVYPGALWAPLGRDAVIFGDLLDAFYLSIGQPGRVARLNGSTPTIRNASKKKLLRFLESAGLDLKNLQRPFIGLDRTTYSPTSQSYLLLSAAYDAYAAQGGKREDLVFKISFFGLGSGDPERFYPTEMTLENHFKTVRTYDTVSKILTLPVGHWTDSLAWHGSFRGLTQTRGRYEGKSGSLSSLSVRKAILGDMIELLQTVSRPEFIATVAYEAKKFGYTFPLLQGLDLAPFTQALEERERQLRENEIAKIADEKAKKEKILTDRIRAARENMNNHLTNYVHRIEGVLATLEETAGEAQRNGLSSNAQKIRQPFTYANDSRLSTSVLIPDALKEPADHIQGTFFAIPLIKVATQALKAGKIHPFDYTQLVGQALSACSASTDLDEKFGPLIEEEPLLRRTLEEEWFFFQTVYQEYSLFAYYGTAQAYERIRAEVMGATVAPVDYKKYQLLEQRTVLVRKIEQALSQLAELEKKMPTAAPKSWLQSALSTVLETENPGLRPNFRAFDSWISMTRNQYSAFASPFSQILPEMMKVVPHVLPSESTYLIPFLQAITRALKQAKIERLHYRKLLAQALAAANTGIVGSSFISDFMRLYHHEPLLARVFQDEEPYFTSNRELQFNIETLGARSMYETIRNLTQLTEQECADVFDTEAGVP